MSEGETIFRGLLHIDFELAKHGVPAMSRRWREEAERFYLSPTAHLWVVCAGRGAGKNLMGIKCDIAETVHAEFVIPPGERHYQINVSENTAEAAKTLRQTAAYLAFLGLAHIPTVDALELGGELSNRGIRLLAARIGAVSGWRSFGYTTQEAAKWNSDGTNPAEEIDASAKGMTVTHRTARRRHFSSPMGMTGFFSDLMDRGNTADQVLSQGASWEFNETITEASTLALETNPRKHAREYRAVRQAGALGVHDPDDVDKMFRPHAEPKSREQRVCIIDANSGKVDSFTWCAIGWNVAEDDTRHIQIDDIDGLTGAATRALSFDQTIDRIAAFCDEREIRSIHGDQREEYAIAAAFRARRLSFTAHPWTAQSKPAAVETTRRWLRSGLVWSVDHAEMRRELLMFEETVSANGLLTYGARGSGHDDYVSLLITAALVEHAGDLEGPMRICRPRSLSHGNDPPLPGRKGGGRWADYHRGRRGF